MVAIAIAAGFATFENACYLTENGAANFSFLLIRGFLRAGCISFAGSFPDSASPMSFATAGCQLPELPEF